MIIENVLAPDTVMAGKYVIVRPLESGGMGDVYDAWQKDLSRPVAIKLLRADIVGDPAMFLRFRREAEAAASLGHPNIVQILDFRNDPGEQPMLVMEKLEGRSLRELLAEAGTLAPPRAVFIALQILSALGAAHDAKIVHRDVKPANVFILKTFAVRDLVKVLDFGVAKVLDPVGGSAPLTNLGQVVGTASYMAPEQAKGLEVDGRADLFAVGGILFEAMSGKKPRELGVAGIIDAGTMPCKKLLDVMRSADPRLAAVVDRALSLDRNERFPTAEAMAKALAPFAPQDLVGRTDPSAIQAAIPATVDDADVTALEDVVTRTSDLGSQPAPLAPPHIISQPPMPPTPPMQSAPVDPTKLSPGAATPGQHPSSPPGLMRTSYQPPLLARQQHQPQQQQQRSRPGPSMAVPPGYSSGHALASGAVPAAPSSRWAGLFYLIPVVVIAGLFVLGAAGFALIGLRGRDHEHALIDNAKPRLCAAPSVCLGHASALGDRYAVCIPASANRYREGDLVFYGTSSSSRPATYLGNGSSGHIRIQTASGLEREIESKELVGAYCLP